VIEMRFSLFKGRNRVVFPSPHLRTERGRVSETLCVVAIVDSRLSARGLTALRLNRGNVFLKKKIYFP
jgi:hypothetical protein